MAIAISHLMRNLHYLHIREFTRFRMENETSNGNNDFKISGICGEAFPLLNSLKKHSKVHDRQEEFVCDYPGCGAKFS